MAAIIFALLFIGTVYNNAGATPAAPELRLNGMNDMVIHTQTDTLMVSIRLDAGDQSGAQADWWVVANTPEGWYYYQYPAMWHFGGDGVEDLVPAYQGALFNLNEPLEILRLSGLAVGTYEFHFGVDTTVNGLVDTGSLSYDRDSFEVVEARSFSVVDTGQDICYDDSAVIPCPESGHSFYGQDAQHTGNASSFADNGDGTITDKVTGLMWQKSPDTEGDGDIDANDKLTYDEAVAGAGTLGLAGYNDWRLPTIKELYSLIEFSGIDPSGYEGTDTSGLTPFIDTVYFDFAYGDTSAGERIIDAQHASNTKYVSTTMNDNETMFGVNFADGRIKGYPKENKSFFVLYVRGNTEYGLNSFTDNDDGTISDNSTGLMWGQNDSAVGLNWKEALAWVQMKNLENYLGYDDWRLPSAKELQSIVDYSRSPDTTGSAAIDSLFNSTSIINEEGHSDYPSYWSSTTHAKWSAVPGGFSVYVAFGRAMGYMNGSWKDVHGAGAQRSDPKTGDPDDYPAGHGPQGDAIRVYNYVRMVRDKDLVADFIADSTRLGAGGTVNFSDLSTGNPTSWSWEFEGGRPSTSTEENPKITYSTSGSYTVTLTAATAGGSYSLTKTDYISVFANSGVFGGYTLLAPLRSNITYLIDTDESVAHTWSSGYTPGNSAYLLEDGTLLRTGKVSNGNRFADTGGAGGIVERFDWDGSVMWSYSLATDEECLHHDVEFLPNGNILMVAWERKTSSEAVAAGRDFSLLADGELWPDKIIVDYSRSPDTSGSAAIDPIFQTASIINEAGKRDYPYFWTSTTHPDGPNPGKDAAYVAFGRALGKMHGRIIDVHGAGAQRSDPKTGKPQMARGPQGDIRRVYNYVRCVRAGSVKIRTSAVSGNKDQYPHNVGISEGIRQEEQRDSRGIPRTQGRRRGFVKRLDRNGDGKVSRVEFDGPKHGFDSHDKNDDGYLTEDEAPKRPPPRFKTGSHDRKMN